MIDKSVEEQFGALIKKRGYDLSKFKFLNINAKNIFKLCYENKFITYIETKDYSSTNMTSTQTKTWYSYRTKLLNYVHSIIYNEGIFDTVCLLNIVSDKNFLEKSIKSLKEQSKKVYIILIIDSLNDMKIAIDHNIEYFYTIDKNISNKFINCINYVRGTIKEVKSIMLCYSNDIYLPYWVEEGYKKIEKNNFDIIGQDNNYIVNSNEKKIFYREINQKYIKKNIHEKFWENIFFYNGMIIGRKYLMRINWKIIDRTEDNITLSIYKLMFFNNPRLWQLNNSYFITIINGDENKNISRELITDGLNKIKEVDSMPNFDNKILSDLNVLFRISTTKTLYTTNNNFELDIDEINNDIELDNEKLKKKIINTLNIEYKKQEKVLQNFVPTTITKKIEEKPLIIPPKVIVSNKQNIEQPQIIQKMEIFSLTKNKSKDNTQKGKDNTQKRKNNTQKGKNNTQKNVQIIQKINKIEFDDIFFDKKNLMLNNINILSPKCKYLSWNKNDFNTKSQKKILTIIPVLGRHEILTQCINAIRRQTIKTDIILLVSNNKDIEYAKDKNLKFVSVPNNPLSHKFQRGVDYAKILEAEYIMFVGSDDILTKNWVRECINFIEKEKCNVVGKNYHYIYDVIDDSKYLRRYVSDKLNYIPINLRKSWCLGSGRIINKFILDKCDWKLFRRELDRGLDGESGLVLYNNGAIFGLIQNENFLSVRDDWDCITKMENIVIMESNELTRIKSFNEELTELKDSYLRFKRLNNENINIMVNGKIINKNKKDIESKDSKEKVFKIDILIFNGFKNEENKEESYNKDIYEKIIKLLPNFKFHFTNIIENIEKLYDKLLLGVLLKNKVTDEDKNLLNSLGKIGIPVINNSDLPNTIRWKNEIDIKEKILVFSNYNRHKFYHKYFNINNEMNKRFNIISKFAKNIKFTKKIEQIYVSYSLLGFKNNIFSKFNFLKEYNDKNKPALFFGFYDKEIDYDTIINHKNIGILIWGGSDLYQKILKDRKILEKLKSMNNIYHVAISKDISRLLHSENIPHIYTIFSFVDKDKFIPHRLGNKIYVYHNDVNLSTYNTPIVEYIKSKLIDFEFIESSNLNVKNSLMSQIYKNCFIGLRLTSFDGNSNTTQELGLMGIKCIHNGDLPNCINWSINNIDDIIDIIKEESKKIGSKNDILSNEVSTFIDSNQNNYIFYKDYFNFLNKLTFGYSISIILNTYGNNNHTLKRIIDDLLNQYGIEKIQVILSTVEGDSSILLYEQYYESNPNVDLCITTLLEHPGKGPKGIYYQINKASEYIKYDWVSYFSGNDKVYNNKFKIEIDTCINNGKLICYSAFDKKIGNNIKTVTFQKKYDYKQHLEGNYISDCSLINRYVFKKIYPFRLEFSNHAFWDFFLRTFEKFGDIFCYNNKPTWEYIESIDSAHIKRKDNIDLQKENNNFRQLMLNSHSSSI